MVGGVHGRGCAWQGVCMTGGVHGRGTCMAGGDDAWHNRRPLQQAARILLECILVSFKISLNEFNL